MTDLGRLKAKIKLSTWAVPGKEQTLDELIEKLGSRVILIERENNRVLIAQEES